MRSLVNVVSVSIRTQDPRISLHQTPEARRNDPLFRLGDFFLPSVYRVGVDRDGRAALRRRCSTSRKEGEVRCTNTICVRKGRLSFGTRCDCTRPSARSRATRPRFAGTAASRGTEEACQTNRKATWIDRIVGKRPSYRPRGCKSLRIVKVARHASRPCVRPLTRLRRRRGRGR